MEQLEHALSRLRQARGARHFPQSTLGRAPHKPLLLLAVFDLFRDGGVVDGKVLVSPELSERFAGYWSCVMPGARLPNMALPFFHLSNDGGFWSLVANPGKEPALEHVDSIQSLPKLAELVAYAQLSPGLVACLSVPSERDRLRDTLIRTYFSPPVQLRLLKHVRLNTEADDYANLLLTRRKVAESGLTASYPAIVRDQGFRKAVVTAYNHRCAMCGIRVRTLDGHVVVDAAHIHPWRDSRNDDPTNGLALCRLCHWSFDEGLIGANRERIILVSTQLSAPPNVPGHLAQLAERPPFSPANLAVAPDPDELSWHQHHVFRS